MYSFTYCNLFKDLNHLHTLNLSGTAISNSAILENLEAFASLTSLDLSSTRISDEAVEAIAQNNTIMREFLLPASRITDQACISLAKMTNLTSLNLRLTNTNENLVLLSSLQNLVILDISLVSGVISETLQSVGKLTELINLNLERNLSITEEDCMALKNLTNLEALNLDSTSVVCLKFLSEMSYLKTISLVWTPINNQAFQILKKSTNLSSLRISYCPNVTDQDLKDIAGKSFLFKF